MLPVLVIGAGPFGLAVAGHLQRAGIEHLIVGRPMGFWRDHMPAGMLLRSGCGWHYDTAGVATIEAYLATRGLASGDVEPLSLDTYLGYPNWFVEQLDLRIREQLVGRIDVGQSGFTATTTCGEAIAARNVVLALGFAQFAHVPEEVAARIPRRFRRHTLEAVDLVRYRGRRVVIIGGRQSAFEWAALLREVGAMAVHVVYRHDTPQFAESDWTWFETKIAEMAADPEWFRRLPEDQKDAVNRRFWEEGRLKLEPWLAPRIAHREVTLWPRNEVAACTPDGTSLAVRLRSGAALTADDVILATGYRVDIGREPLFALGDLGQRVVTAGGFPCLDRNLQASVPGLYITSMPAVRDFGLFFAFTISARTSAKLIGEAIAQSL